MFYDPSSPKNATPLTYVGANGLTGSIPIGALKGAKLVAEDLVLLRASPSGMGNVAKQVIKFIPGQPTAVYDVRRGLLSTGVASSDEAESKATAYYNSEAGTCGSLVYQKGGVVGVHCSTNGEGRGNNFILLAPVVERLVTEDFFRDGNAASSSSSVRPLS